MAVFNMHQAKTELSRLVAMAMAGDEVVIARHNIAVAKIVPVGSASAKGEQWAAASVSSGFGEEGQAELTGMTDFLGQVRKGEEFTFSHEGQALARIVPLEPASPEARGYGILAHLRGKLPDDLFLGPMSEDELQLWEKGDLP
jgi:antitoxin (DNA-binding transcriptional repressor) of toxin-antitoxin stability system